MANIQSPAGLAALTASQSRGISTPRSNVYEGRDVNIGRVSAQFSGGPAVSGAVGAGLQALGGGLGKWYQALEAQEQTNQTFEAMEALNAFRERQRSMFDQMEGMKGRDGIPAPYLMEDFYKKERENFDKLARGDFQKMIYARAMDSAENQGLDAAMSHRTREMDNYQKSVMMGDQAQFEAVAADWRSSSDDLTRAAIPYVQRSLAYYQSKGLDPRSAALKANKDYQKALLTNAYNRLTNQIAASDPEEAQRIIDGIPKSTRLPQNIAEMADKAGQAKGVDSALVRAIIMAESGGNPRAISSVGARGLMQLMPGTAKDLGVNPDDPEQNVRGGTEYISRMLKRYNGNLKHALMAYNWGPGEVDRWLQNGGTGAVPRETQKYVRGVMADYQMQKRGGKQTGGMSLLQPVPGYTKISSGYGPRNTGIAGASTFHEAIDIPAPIGTPVQATIGGTVKTAANKGKNGNYIVIDGDDGREHYFLHLNNFAAGLMSGQRIEQGQEIGGVGNSGTLKIGPHLDYRIKESGKFIDPTSALSERGQPVMLAGNTLVEPGDVVSDAFGVAEGAVDPEAMSLPEAEINFGESTADWLLGDDAAIVAELGGPEYRLKMQQDLNKIVAEQTKAEKETAKQQLDDAVLNRTLTPEMLVAQLPNLSRDNQIYYFKAMNGEAGIWSEVKKQEVKDLDKAIGANILSGAIYDRDGLSRYLANNNLWELVTPEKMSSYESQIKNRTEVLNNAIEQFVLKHSDKLNPSGKPQFYLVDPKKKKDPARMAQLESFKLTAMEAFHTFNITAQSTQEQIERALEATLETYEKENPLEYMQIAGLDMAGEQIAALADKRIRDGAEDMTPYNQQRSRMAVQDGVPMREIMAPSSKTWKGQGRLTLNRIDGKVSAHKDFFEKVGNAWNTDPDLLAAIAHVVSGGDRLATGQFGKNGRGMMQLTQEMIALVPDITRPFMGDGRPVIIQDITDPYQSIQSAAAILDALMRENGDDVIDALTKYAVAAGADDPKKFVSRVDEAMNDKGRFEARRPGYGGYGGGTLGNAATYQETPVYRPAPQPPEKEKKNSVSTGYYY